MDGGNYKMRANKQLGVGQEMVSFRAQGDHLLLTAVIFAALSDVHLVSLVVAMTTPMPELCVLSVMPDASSLSDRISAIAVASAQLVHTLQPGLQSPRTVNTAILGDTITLSAPTVLRCGLGTPHFRWSGMLDALQTARADIELKALIHKKSAPLQHLKVRNSSTQSNFGHTEIGTECVRGALLECLLKN
jgi:hypothetical protein